MPTSPPAASGGAARDLEDQLYRVRIVADAIAAIHDLVQGDASDRTDVQFEFLTVGNVQALLDLLTRELRGAVDRGYELLGAYYRENPHA